MATALKDLSDVDFYIYLDGSIEYVTRAHRIAFAKTLQQELATQGLHYPELRLGESRIHGIDGCSGGQPAVDFDVIFARFAGQEPRVPPARYTLPHAVQLACCFLRLMPEAYTNLVRPQSSALIELVHAEAQAAGYAGARVCASLCRRRCPLCCLAAQLAPATRCFACLLHRSAQDNDQSLANIRRPAPPPPQCAPQAPTLSCCCSAC